MFLLKRSGIYYVEYLDEQENRIRRISTKQKIKRDAIKFLTDFDKNLKTKKTFKHIFLEEFEKNIQITSNQTFQENITIM